MDNRELVKRAQASKSDRDTVQSVWDAIREFVIPYRGHFFDTAMTEGSINWYQTRRNFDSTASAAHSQLAASLHSNITSPVLQWFTMRYRDEKLNKSKAALQWVQDVSRQIYFELQDSNFNLEVDETYQDLSGFGTAFMTLEEDRKGTQWDGFDFTSVPLKEGFFEQDYKGRVLYFYRRLRWTAGQIVSKFGTDVCDKIIKAEEIGSNERFTVWFCVFPRSGKGIRQNADLGEKLSPGKRPWGYKYLLEDDASLLGKEGGYYDMPVYAPRWRKTSESIWGNGPAHMVLGDIMSLNRAGEIHESISAKMADPPLLAEERAILGDLKIMDGGLSVIRKINGVAPLPLSNRPEALYQRMDTLRESIRVHFFSDQLQFPPPQGTPMSATEAKIRYDQLQKLLGPTLGRIQNDLLTPIVSRAFRMLMREGMLPEPPPIVTDNQSDIDLEYLGPMATAQRLDSLSSKERFVSFAANVAPVFPEAVDVVDIDGVMRSAAMDLSIPADNIRDEKETKVLRDDRTAKKNAMEEAAIAEQQGNAGKAIAGAQAEAQ